MKFNYEVNVPIVTLLIIIILSILYHGNNIDLWFDVIDDRLISIEVDVEAIEKEVIALQ